MAVGNKPIRRYIEKKREKPLRRGLLGRVAYQFALALSNAKLDIENIGQENLPSEGSYILAANHETYVDALWIMAALPKSHFKRFCSLGAQDLLTRYGYFGRLIMRVGSAIPINRFGNPIRALNAAKGVLEEGRILLVHPEGTRSKNGRLGKIQEGACFLAKKTKALIVPVFIDGAYEIFSRHMKRPQFRNPKTGLKNRLIIRFGKPMNPEHYKGIREMNEALTTWFTERFQQKQVPRVFEPSH